MATAIETEDDVDRLMNFTGEAVGLLFDTGHITFAGGDALRMAKRHGKRINHVHTKDIRKDVLAKVDPQTTSFLDAVLMGVFTVPGDGMIDFKAVAQLCAEIGYEGWFVVEAEQDPKKANPLKYAKIGHEALSEALDQAGYTIEEIARPGFPRLRFAILVSCCRRSGGGCCHPFAGTSRPAPSMPLRNSPQAALCGPMAARSVLVEIAVELRVSPSSR